MQLYYGSLAWIVLMMVVERVKTTPRRLLKNPLLAPFRTAPLHSYSDWEKLLRSWQICFRTMHFHNNLAAGTGQFGPKGHLLPTTALKQKTPSRQGEKMAKTAFNRNYFVIVICKLCFFFHWQCVIKSQINQYHQCMKKQFAWKTRHLPKCNICLQNAYL